VKPPYSDELAALRATYDGALAADVSEIRALVLKVGSAPAAFVGTGGTMPVAFLAAQLHERVCRQPGAAMTALQFLDAPVLTRRGAVVISSSLKHPDARVVLSRLKTGRWRPAGVLTHRSDAFVEALAGPDTRTATVPSPAAGDGFLATNSVLQFSTLLVRAYLGEVLPAALTIDQVSRDAPLRTEVLLLSSPDVWPAAADLEVRLSEAGLAAVQIVDFRNFAHGRHTGFHRRREHVSVIAMCGQSLRELAESTLAALPPDQDVQLLTSPLSRGADVIDLLGQSMHLAAVIAAQQGVDIARPRVPNYGRRLYRLPLQKRLPAPPDGAVERKLLALGVGPMAPTLRDSYTTSARAWKRQIAAVRFAGLVLDYDGTVCWTKHRFSIPEAATRDALKELLAAGTLLGFATGRGQSLYHELRQWLPNKHWRQVFLGLYNGGVRLGLDEELPELRQPSAWSRAVARALHASVLGGLIEVEQRTAQVNVSLLPNSFAPEGQLAALVQQALDTAGKLEARVFSSGHSTDVIPAHSSKATVVEEAKKRCGGEVLAIGDQGHPAGNDFELLACQPWTLSVDRCSADPTRCWYVGTGRQHGPALLQRYLSKLESTSGGLRMRRLELP
jgi:hydroxymethylpyrimidine pyrophosphatase-like HAD family hydrolase